jgi:hypothetical protein
VAGRSIEVIQTGQSADVGRWRTREGDAVAAVCCCRCAWLTLNRQQTARPEWAEVSLGLSLAFRILERSAVRTPKLDASLRLGRAGRRIRCASRVLGLDTRPAGRCRACWHRCRARAGGPAGEQAQCVVRRGTGLGGVGEQALARRGGDREDSNGSSRSPTTGWWMRA